MTELSTEDRLILALADLHRRINGLEIQIRRPSDCSIELIVKEHAPIRVKIDANLNHGRSHLHIDVGRLRHHASYAIDNGERLAGRWTQYEHAVQLWIATHRTLLSQIYEDIRAAGANEQQINTLRDSRFPG